MFGAILGGVMQGIGGLFSMGQARRLRRQANRINPVWTNYKTPEEVAYNKSLAQNAYNGRMGGASQMEQNIYSSQGNMMNAAARGASNQAQYLGMIAGGQARTNDALANLQMREAQNKNALLGNLMRANEAVASGKDTEWKFNKMDRYLEDVQRKQMLLGAANNMQGQGMGMLGSAAMNLGSGIDSLMGNSRTKVSGGHEMGSGFSSHRLGRDSGYDPGHF